LKYDIVVIGGGAAGMFAAITAAANGQSVLVLEHNKEIGSKILISGGGRCNFTNINAKPENYISSNPHFIRSAFSQYSPQDFIALVEKHNIDYYEKKLGQLFCKKSSREIINMLLVEANEYNVKISYNESVLSVAHQNNHYITSTSNGKYSSDKVIVASGGLSFPKKGATPIGYDIAKQFGHNIIPTKPALVPLTLAEGELSKLKDLSGISFDANVVFRNNSFRENVLITHRGFSGPAILQISSYWDFKSPIEIEIEPNIDFEEVFLLYAESNKEIKTILGEYLPSRFVEYILEKLMLPKYLYQFTPNQKKDIRSMLNSWTITPNGTEVYAKAEVTLGGVDVNELNQKNFESKKSSGLYFIGEVIDVTGWLGGYNFQLAWASGFCAGRA